MFVTIICFPLHLEYLTETRVFNNMTLTALVIGQPFIS